MFAELVDVSVFIRPIRSIRGAILSRFVVGGVVRLSRSCGGGLQTWWDLDNWKNGLILEKSHNHFYFTIGKFLPNLHPLIVFVKRHIKINFQFIILQWS